MQNIVIDIAHRGVIPPIRVTEGDAMSRFFSIVLLDGGTAYVPPENPSYSVRYECGLNTGWYDTITVPGGTNRGAVSVSGNTYTVEIAEDATHGKGELALMITGDNGYQLTVTGIRVESDYIPAESAGETQNYYNAFLVYAERAEAAAQQAIEYGATIEVNSQKLVITHYTGE